MLRIKRSVQATYNTQVNFMSSQMMKATTSSTGTGESRLHAGETAAAAALVFGVRVPRYLYIYFFASLCLTLSPFVSQVSDLAPGQLGLDDMKMLEQKAQQLAAEAEQDKAKPKEKILFVRSVWRLSLLCAWNRCWRINPPLFGDSRPRGMFGCRSFEFAVGRYPGNPEFLYIYIVLAQFEFAQPVTLGKRFPWIRTLTNHIGVSDIGRGQKRCCFTHRIRQESILLVSSAGSC